MRRRMFCIANALTLAGFMLVNMMPGIATAGSRIDSEDMVFSYARESDRLVFGGLGYIHTIRQDSNHPDKSALYVQDLKTGTKTKVFEAVSGYVGNPQVAPSGTATAVQVSQDERFINPRLLVLSADGKKITSFAHGREFSWSPNSRFLAYTTGDVEGIYTIHPTGTFFYDQCLEMTIKIFDKGDYLSWSQSDDSLYIWDESDGDLHVWRYDPLTQKVVETNYNGISFSSTGRYYHGTRSHGIGTVDVFDTQMNQPFLSHRPRIAALLPSARIVGWAPEGDVLVLEVKRQELRSEDYPQGRLDTVLYDVPHDIARIIPDDSVVGWLQGRAIVHDRGKFPKRLLTTLPFLPETPERPAKPLEKPSSRPKP